MAPRRRAVEVAALVLADAVGIQLAFAAAYWLRYVAQVGGSIPPFNQVPYAHYLPWSVVLTGILVVAYWLEGLYARQRRVDWFESVYGLTTGTIVGVALLTLLIFGLRPLAQSRLMLPYAAVLIVVTLAAIRVVDAEWRRARLRRGHGAQRTLIVGAGELGRTIMSNVIARPDMGYQLVGFLDDDPGKQAQAIGRFKPLGGTADLAAVLRAERVDNVVITLPWQSRERIMELVTACEAAGARVRIVPDLFQMSLNRVDVDSLNGIPLIAVRAPTIRGWHYRLKRAMDVAIAGAILVLGAPVLGAIALAIALTSPGPILYRQQRVGRDGRPFTLYKFRSMVVGADQERGRLAARNEATGPLFKMRADPRLTPVGRVIRRFSLDELPQLWNVLRGDMSLVGPRPPMPSEVAEYQPWHRRRLEVAPGMTGLWQVSGRSELTFDEMVLLDLFYAENWSLGLDVRILLRTVPCVLIGTGAY